MKNEFFTELGISINLLLAGFFGALLLVRKEGKTLKENILTLVTGSFSAAYIAPFLIEFLNLQENKNALSFFGFITGFGSIKIAEFFMNKFFKKQEQDGNNN